jgi:hypothetical protein
VSGFCLALSRALITGDNVSLNGIPLHWKIAIAALRLVGLLFSHCIVQRYYCIVRNIYGILVPQTGTAEVGLGLEAE